MVNSLANVGGLFVLLLRSPFKDELFKQPYASSSECADASLYSEFPNKKKRLCLLFCIMLDYFIIYLLSLKLLL